MFLSTVLFIGCQGDIQGKPTKNDKDNFNSDDSLRIIEPSNGATVDSIFEVKFEAGSNVENIDVIYKEG